MKTIISIFGSNRLEHDSAGYREARELGRLLALSGYTVCNGGYGGVMEATARGAFEAGGHTIGITLRGVRGSANPYIREEIEAESLFERLRLLLEKGRGFVILRGGTGTLVELALCVELQLKGIMPPKPTILLGSYWKGVFDTIESEVEGINPFCTESPLEDHAPPTQFPETILFTASSASEAVALMDRTLRRD